MGKKRADPMMVQYKCGTPLRTKKCTADPVSLGKGYVYSKTCYRLQDPSIKSVDRQKMCRIARLGCAVCKEAMCAICWQAAYDKYKNS